MLYIDDIQHCHPEFLQKFISLCDAQRKIEGVFRGKTRTLRTSVDAKSWWSWRGNPYTESGQKFQIPDMLTSRADTYNLGDVTGNDQEAFELSYLENAMTSNAALSALASRSQEDVCTLIRLAESSRDGDAFVGVDLDGNYSTEQLTELPVSSVSWFISEKRCYKSMPSIFARQPCQTTIAPNRHLSFRDHIVT